MNGSITELTTIIIIPLFILLASFLEITVLHCQHISYHLHSKETNYNVYGKDKITAVGYRNALNLRHSGPIAHQYPNS